MQYNLSYSTDTLVEQGGKYRLMSHKELLLTHVLYTWPQSGVADYISTNIIVPQSS